VIVATLLAAPSVVSVGKQFVAPRAVAAFAFLAAVHRLKYQPRTKPHVLAPPWRRKVELGEG
jgi:hypothetical protein